MSTLYVNTITPNSGDTVNVSGSLFVSGTINLGDAGTDSISFGAEVSSSIIPDANNTYDLGSAAKSWKVIHGTSSLALTASHVLLATSASHLTANGASPSQTSITSVGTLTSLGVAGNVFSINSAGSASMGNITSSGNISASGTITGNAGVITSLTSTTVTASNAVLSGDLSVGDDLSLTSDNAVFNMGAGNDFKITHDGTTGAKIQGSPIQLQSTGSLVLSSSVDATLHGADDVLISALDDIEIVAADEIQLTTTSADGHITLTSAHTAGTALHIDANANAGSIVDIDAGILDIDVTGVTTINSTNIALNGPVTSSGNISASGTITGNAGVITSLTSTTVTASNAIVIGDLNVGDDLSLTSDSAVFNMGAGNDFRITHDGTTGAKIQGSPIEVQSTGSFTVSSSVNAEIHGAGDVRITSTDDIVIQATDEISLTSTDDINLLTTSADGLITLHSAHTAGQAILIDANANAGSILDVDAGILDIDVQGAATIDADTLVVSGIRNKNVVEQSGTAAEDLTAVDQDVVWYANTAQAADITLPQATANNVGMVIKIIVGTTDWATSAFKLGFANGGSTVMTGYIRLGSNAGSEAVDGFVVTANAKSLTIDADDATGAGGAIGSTYTFTYLEANLVHVEANGQVTTGTPALDAGASLTAGI